MEFDVAWGIVCLAVVVAVASAALAIKDEIRWRAEARGKRNAQMTAADLDALEAAEKAATPGPWREGIDGNLRLYGPDGMGEHSGLVASAYKVRGNLSLIVLLRNAAPALFAAARERDKLRVENEELFRRIVERDIIACSLREALEAADGSQ